MASKDEQHIDDLEQALGQLESGMPAAQIANTLDDETAALFNLAARLEQQLPDDLPDPEFRDRLGLELTGAEPPVALSSRRGRRFFYDWRFGVAAGALAAILLMAVIFGTNTLMGDSPEPPVRETVVSAMSVAKESTAPGSTTTPEIVTNTQVFPPIDADHVVIVPLGLGAARPPSGTPEATPAPGIEMATALPDLPTTAPTWLLTGPDSTEEFLQTLVARTGISGQIEPAANEGPNAFVVVDQTGFPAIHWNQDDAFFRYDRGTGEPTPPAARATTDPAVTASEWLREIGFDLTTITYKESVRESDGQAVVTFTPDNLPATAIAPGLGATVGVGPDGSIQFAQGFWLSLSESAEVAMRTSQEALDAMKSGEWYSVVPESDSSQLRMKVSSAEMSYILTRADGSSYLLQPVVAFGGERWTSSGAVQDQVYVAAIKK